MALAPSRLVSTRFAKLGLLLLLVAQRMGKLKTGAIGYRCFQRVAR